MDIAAWIALVTLIVAILSFLGRDTIKKWGKRKNNGRKHNLPQTDRSFVGRKQDKKLLLSRLKSSDKHIVSVVGIGGIGKTSLVLNVAHLLARRDTFDKIIWIDAKNGTIDLNAIYDTIISVAGKVEWQKSSIQEKSTNINNDLFHKQEYLVIFDNFESIEDKSVENFIKNIPAPTKVILTSRKEHFANSETIKLQGLSQEEAHKLIRKEVNPIYHTIKDDDINDKLNALIEQTDGSPLALKHIIAQVNCGARISDMLNYFLDQEEIFQTIYEYSFLKLSDNEKRIMFLLSLFPGPLERSVITEALELPAPVFDKSIKQLIAYCLIDIVILDRNYTTYYCHELTKSYFRDKIDAGEWDPLLESILKAFLSRINKDLVERMDNFDFINLQRYNILQACEMAFTNSWELGKELLCSIKWSLWEYGLWDLRNMVYIKCYNANPLLSRTDHIMLSTDIAWVYFRQKNYDKCNQWFPELTESDIDTLPPEVLGTYYSVLGMIEKKNRMKEESEEHLLKALDLLPDTPVNLLERMRIITYIGELHRGVGNNEMAQTYFEKTLELATANNYKAGICWSLQNIGTIQDDNTAKITLKKGLRIAKEIDRTHTIAECKFLLSEIYKKKKITRYKAKKNAADAEELFSLLGLNGYKVSDRNE